MLQTVISVMHAVVEEEHPPVKMNVDMNSSTSTRQLTLWNLEK